MHHLPPELVQAVEHALHSEGPAPRVAAHPDAARRLSVALECWLHGVVTTEQAVQVLRQPPHQRT